MKAINVKDETDSIKVSLWRDLAESSFVGKYVMAINIDTDEPDCCQECIQSGLGNEATEKN